MHTYRPNQHGYSREGLLLHHQQGNGYWDILVHQKDNRPSMTRQFYGNEQKREEHFLLDDQPFGPQRYYRYHRQTGVGNHCLGKAGFTKCVYLAAQEVMEVRK